MSDSKQRLVGQRLEDAMCELEEAKKSLRASGVFKDDDCTMQSLEAVKASVRQAYARTITRGD